MEKGLGEIDPDRVSLMLFCLGALWLMMRPEDTSPSMKVNRAHVCGRAVAQIGGLQAWINLFGSVLRRRSR